MAFQRHDYVHVDFSENTLFACLASFADSNLLDFAQASDSMT